MTFVITSIGVVIYIFITLKYYKLSAFMIFINSCELYTTAVPPILPLCLNLGLEYAVRNLKAKKIKTLLMGKINQAGRIKTMCFDKTGTLTENELYFKGYFPVND